MNDIIVSRGHIESITAGSVDGELNLTVQMQVTSQEYVRLQQIVQSEAVITFAQLGHVPTAATALSRETT